MIKRADRRTSRSIRRVAGVFLTFALATPAAADTCNLPLRDTTTGLYALATAAGQGGCAVSVCDADDSGAVTDDDARALVRSAVGLSAELSCPSGSAAVCGRPSSSAASPELADTVAILRAAVAAKACPHDTCDVDGSGSVAVRDALASYAASAGRSSLAMCPAEPSPRARWSSTVPGENGCVGALSFEKCRLRASGGPTRSARLRCRLTAETDTSLDLASDDIAVFLDDTDGRCFEAVVTPQGCRQRSNSLVCKNAGSGIDRLQIRQKSSQRARTTVVVRAADNIPCLSAAASPWVIGLSIGDDCNEIGCPVTKNRPTCPSTCGNFALDDGEQCDAGPAGNATCTLSCSLVPRCGDGTINQPTETCDDGGSTSTCDADCTDAACGDGFTNAPAGETCDDGNTLSGDGCSATCFDEFCGNGVVEAPEECDDGIFGSATCDRDCTLAACGDGLTNTAAGEDCDSGTLAPGLDCTDFGFQAGPLACDDVSCSADVTGCVSYDEICSITFGVTSSGLLGALQYEVDYAAASGDFLGSADGVSCSTLPLGTLSAYNDIDAERRFISGIITLSGFSTPTDVSVCDFATSALPIDPNDFTITVQDASDPALNPVAAAMAVSDVSCTPVTTTTTTTIAPTGGDYLIEFSLDDPELLGALQYNVDYSAADGGFVGSADGVECMDSPASIASYNDDEAFLTLRSAMIDLAGFQGPLVVSRCRFAANAGAAAPTAGDFTITVVDAAHPNLTPAVVSVSVTSVIAE